MDVLDPWVNKEDAKYEYGITPIEPPKKGHYDAIVLSVVHNEFIDLGVDAIRSFGKCAHVLYDIK